MIIGDDISSSRIHEEPRPVAETCLDSENRMPGSLKEQRLCCGASPRWRNWQGLRRCADAGTAEHD
jgi:hypothetical protein